MPHSVNRELTGLLSRFPITDIIQFVGFSHKTGELYLINGEGKKGSLFFQNGNMMHAQMGNKEGVCALELIFKWANGTFHFVSDQTPPKITIDGPVSLLLLEMQKRQDELINLFSQLPSDDTILYVVPFLEEVPQLNSLEWQVLSLVNGKRAIQRICQKIGDELHVKRTLLSMLKKGVITVSPPDSSFFDLVPILQPASQLQGERAFPPQIRTNLVLKAIDGVMTIRELKTMLRIEENDLVDDIKMLVELKWIHFSEYHEKLYQVLREEL